MYILCLCVCAYYNTPAYISPGGSFVVLDNIVLFYRLPDCFGRIHNTLYLNALIRPSISIHSSLNKTNKFKL